MDKKKYNLADNMKKAAIIPRIYNRYKQLSA